MDAQDFAPGSPLSRRLRILAGALALVLVLGLLAACGGDDDDDGDLTKMNVGLSFIPNIQFAPFYVAIEKGFYKDAGVEVELRHHNASADLFGALVSGDEDLIFAGGDEVLQARSRDIPIVYVGEVYTQYPVGLIVPADSEIQTLADLAGHTVGIPGEFGATYIGLLALLESAGLTRDDIEIQSIGFTQAGALQAGQVDAVMGYVNNEPVQLEKAGFATRTFPVNDAMALVSNGLAALEESLEDDNDADNIRAVIAATLEGVQYAIDNPEEAVEIAKEYVPGLDDEQQAADALAVLQATLPLWQSTGGPGTVDAAAWQAMAEFLNAHQQLENEVDAGEAFSNDFLPED